MPAPAFEIVPQRHAHWIRLPSFASVYGLSCGRCRDFSLVHPDCVPRKGFTSHSTPMPSGAKKPSSWATKSLMPMPLARRELSSLLLLSNYDDELRRQITTTSGYSRHYTPDKSM